MQNDQYGQNSQNGAQNNQYGIQNNPYPNVAYPPVQYGPAVQPAPYQQNVPYQQAPSAVNSGKSKKTAMIFCIISNVLMVLGVLAIPFLFVMILAMGFGAVGGNFFYGVAHCGCMRVRADREPCFRNRGESKEPQEHLGSGEHGDLNHTDTDSCRTRNSLCE